MHTLVIVGAGAFARELRRFVPACFPRASVRLKGFLSNNPHDLDNFNISEPILSDPENYIPEKNDRFLLGIGNIPARRRIVQELKSKGAKFLSLIHPTAYIDPTAKIGEGCTVFPFATIMNDTKIDEFVTMNLYSSAGHDSQIGAFCNLSPYATMNGFAVLEENVFLGTHATVLAHRRVGRGSKVSANSVVVHDARPKTIVFGVPGKHTSLIQVSDEST